MAHYISNKITEIIAYNPNPTGFVPLAKPKSLAGTASGRGYGPTSNIGSGRGLNRRMNLDDSGQR
jgi:hypothetical protein